MIREATEKDAKAITDIYNYYIQNTVITFEEDLLEEKDLIQRIKKIQDSGFNWLVAEENSKVIGYAYSSKWNDRGAYRNTAEVSVYLAQDTQANGWGSRLYESLFASLERRSIHIVIGGISLPNPTSVALHEKFGMKKVAHFKQVGYKFEQWLDVGYWQIQLNT